MNGLVVDVEPFHEILGTAFDLQLSKKRKEVSDEDVSKSMQTIHSRDSKIAIESSVAAVHREPRTAGSGCSTLWPSRQSTPLANLYPGSFAWGFSGRPDSSAEVWKG